MGKPREIELKSGDLDKLSKIFRQSKAVSGNSPTSKEILYALAAGGAIATAFIAPNAVSLFKPLLGLWDEYEPYRVRQQINRLKEQKWVEIINEGGEEVVKITENGRVRALRFRLNEMDVKKPKTWDRKWRIVIFDIPENNRGARDLFRQLIKNLGFYELQKSVFVHPFPCFDEIEYLRQVCGTGVSVRCLIAEKIEDEGDLLNFFNLS